MSWTTAARRAREVANSVLLNAVVFRVEAVDVPTLVPPEWLQRTLTVGF